MRQETKQQVLIVGGAMRSGTTVIHRALCAARNSNPYISESWFLHDLFNMYAWNLSRFEVRHQDQFGDREKFAKLFQLNLGYYLDQVSSEYENPEVLILKHPELTRHFLTIKRMAPDVKFLVIVRDPRDVIASIKDVNARHKKTNTWTPHSNLETMKDFCGFYAGYYKAVTEHRAEFGKDLAFVRYEDVVSEPARVFAEIGAFCGAVYEGDEMTKFSPEHAKSKNFARDVRLKDPLSGAFWSELYTKDLSQESIGKHKKSLSVAEIQEIESLLENMGRTFRYW